MPSPDTLAVKQMIISTWQIKEQCSLSVQVSSLQWLQLRLSFFWAKYTAQEAFIPQSRVQQMLCFQLRRLAWIWSVQLEAHQHTHTHYHYYPWLPKQNLASNAFNPRKRHLIEYMKGDKVCIWTLSLLNLPPCQSGLHWLTWWGPTWRDLWWAWCRWAWPVALCTPQNRPPLLCSLHICPPPVQKVMNHMYKFTCTLSVHDISMTWSLLTCCKTGEAEIGGSTRSVACWRVAFTFLA